MSSFEKSLEVFNAFVHKYGRLPTEVDPEYLEMLRMSKYRVLDVPDFSPGKCANCGASKSDGRKYVDFGLEVSWYGIVYLCGLCIEDIARNLGLFTKLEEKLTSLNGEVDNIDSLREQGKQLEDKVLAMVEEVKEYFTNVHLTSDDRSTNNSSDLGASKTTTESGTTQTKPRVTKSTPSSRPKDVPNLTELLER